LNVIKWQIKSENIFMIGVVDRCEYGYPRVILLNPKMENDEINYQAISNILWLTCPYLNEKIHELENAGYIEKITEFINSDISLTAKMNNAQANSYYLRKHIVQKYFSAGISEDKLSKFNTGIGGVRNGAMLKCLHAHFCNFIICNDNIAGIITIHLLNFKINCDEAICKNAH